MTFAFKTEKNVRMVEAGGIEPHFSLVSRQGACPMLYPRFDGSRSTNAFAQVLAASCNLRFLLQPAPIAQWLKGGAACPIG